MKEKNTVDSVICKFQRPLMTTGDESEVLVYNEDDTIMFSQVLDEDDMKTIFPEDEYKTYWVCEPNEEGWLVPVKQVEEQDW